MKIYFLFLCLIAQVICGMDFKLLFLEIDLGSASCVTSYGFNPTTAKRIIADHRQTAEVASVDVFGRCISDAESALNKYEEAGCWGKPLFPWVGKAAYGMGALGIVLGATTVATKGATSLWMLAPVPLLAPVVGRFCVHRYYVRQAKDIISFMKQAKEELEAARSHTQEPDKQIETSAVPSNKKKTHYSCSIL